MLLLVVYVMKDRKDTNFQFVTECKQTLWKQTAYKFADKNSHYFFTTALWSSDRIN